VKTNHGSASNRAQENRKRPETPAIANSPAHMSQIRDDVKQALLWKIEQLNAEDAALESALLRSHRNVRLSMSIPSLCQTALECQNVTLRQAIQMVAIQTGFHESHVQRLYYRTKADHPHVIRLKKGDL